MTKQQNYDSIAPAIVAGHEDKFYYEIANTCVMCGSCASGCPVRLLSQVIINIGSIPPLALTVAPALFYARQARHIVYLISEKVCLKIR